MTAGLAGQAGEEVRALHAFFVAWFRGETDRLEDFAACEAALAADFRMITPDGGVHERPAVIGRLRAAHGSAPGEFSIEILQTRAVWQSSEAVLLEFIERQYRDGKTASRRSTALMTIDTAAPRGVVWRHLHETWMQAAG